MMSQKITRSRLRVGKLVCGAKVFSLPLAVSISLVTVLAYTDCANGATEAVWKLDEGTGTQAADSEGPTFHDAELKGGASWTGAGAPFGLSPDDAVYIDGVETGHHGTDPGDVNWVDAGTFDVAGSGITMAAWIKPDSFGIHDARVINKGSTWGSADIWWMLSTFNGTGLRMRLKTDDGGANAGTSTLISPNGFLEPDVWHHVAGTYDGSMMRLWHWKPGDTAHTEIASMEKTGTVAVDPSVSVSIGNIAPGLPGGLSRIFHGAIDDVRVYDEGLTQTALSALLDLGNTTSADFDSDGDIDGADFLKWQRGETPGLGSTEELASWKQQYGGTAATATAAAVPEPSTTALVLMLTSMLLMRRQSMTS